MRSEVGSPKDTYKSLQFAIFVYVIQLYCAPVKWTLVVNNLRYKSVFSVLLPDCDN